MRTLIIEGDEPLIDSSKTDHEEDEKYIFKGSPVEMANFMELTVELKSNSSVRILVVASAKYFLQANIANRDLIQYLCQRIGEEMEKFREYNGLSGLRAAGLMIKGSKKVLPEYGRIGDYIKNCDELVCDLLADEVWLFVKYDLCSIYQKKNAAAELKVAKDCSVGYLQLVVEKLALNLWSYLNSNHPKYYYVLNEIMTKVAKVPKTNLHEISFDNTPGEIISEVLNDKKIGTCFDSESVLIVKVVISTLEEELMADPVFALSKFEGKREENLSFSQEELDIEPRESTVFPSYLNIKQLFSPRIRNIRMNDTYGLFVVGCETFNYQQEIFGNSDDTRLASLLIAEEEEHKDGSVGHARRPSKTTLEQKTFNMASLSLRKGSDELPRRRESLEYNSKIIPYKKAIHFIRMDPKFMTKEELLQVKVFPMREWLFIKNKAPRLSLDSSPVSTSAFRGWRLVVIILMGLVLVFMIGFFFVLIVE